MDRAIQFARLGNGSVSPNPMVGAVIVHKGRIIGEGFHRRFGENHAEVNAIRSVSSNDRPLLSESTLYVTLEPCSHYGKTPPCAKMLIDQGIRHIVIGCADPFAKVHGNGIRMLREAGCEVIVGIHEEKCLALNPHFLKAHSNHRPYVLLKWAQSASGFIGAIKDGKAYPMRFSTIVTETLAHKLRSEYDAIMVGSHTVRTDNPRLTTRLWTGHNPLRVTLDRQGINAASACHLYTDGLRTVLFTTSAAPKPSLPTVNTVIIPESDSPNPINFVCRTLYDMGITSLIVEGGASLLKAFLKNGIWDEIRIETNPRIHLTTGIAAPTFPTDFVGTQKTVDGNLILSIKRPDSMPQFRF